MPFQLVLRKFKGRHRAFKGIQYKQECLYGFMSGFYFGKVNIRRKIPLAVAGQITSVKWDIAGLRSSYI